jgi:hypothetical protein
MAFALAAVVLAGFWYFLAQRPAVGATPANFARVRLGMSKQEVEALLGPPGDYLSAWTLVEGIYYSAENSEKLAAPAASEGSWYTPEGRFVVRYDARGEVAFTVAGEVTALHRLGFLEGVNNWLRRLTGK